jgi:cell division protein FtsQ
MAGRGGPGGRRWRLVRAGTDAVPDSLRRFMSRASGRRLDQIPWRAIGSTALVLAVLGWVVWVSPFLAVRSVEISGVALLTEEEVLEAAEVPIGRPLARVDTDAVRLRVAALPAALAVDVSRGWPGTLRIQVTERTAVAAAKRDKAYQLYDPNGVMFQTVASPPSDVVLVEFPDTDQPDKPMRAALRVVAALTPQLRSELVKLVVNSPAGIVLMLRKDRVVTWGDAEQCDLKAKVATALLAQKGKQIDVSVPEIVTIQ